MYTCRDIIGKSFNKQTFKFIYSMYKLFFILIIFGDSQIRLGTMFLYHEFINVFVRNKGVNPDDSISKNHQLLAICLCQVFCKLVLVLNYLIKELPIKESFNDSKMNSISLIVDFFTGRLYTLADDLSFWLEKTQAIINNRYIKSRLDESMHSSQLKA
jgi:hypothetical protein